MSFLYTTYKMGDSCPVCCDPFTDVKRVRVKCAYCHYDACASCYRQYIGSSMQDAHCMSCRHVWTRDFLTTYFPLAWFNGDYKKHREQILMEREKQLLPESQELVANYREARGLRQGLMEKMKTLTDLKRKAALLNQEVMRDRYRAERIEQRGYRTTPRDDMIVRGAEKKQRVEFITPCPVDECRGFMNDSMTCGVCTVKACTKCGVILSEDHECVKETVESFAMIKKDTRPCPKCAIPTFKISGCSQMWCTGCKTPWDWNTNQIVRGIIHNPHYFQYLRERSTTGDIPRQPGDGDEGPPECNERLRRTFPSGWDLSHKSREAMISDYGRNPSAEVRESEAYVQRTLQNNELAGHLRKLSHIQEVEMPRLRPRYTNRDNADLRLKYLINEIDEKTFRTQLQRREKKRSKDVAVLDIYQMICDTARDTFWTYLDTTRTIESALEELRALKKYANENLEKVREQYNMIVGNV